MKNKDYNIFGKIMSVIADDYPPQISNNFSDKVMTKINLDKRKYHKHVSNTYFNIAASVFFAVITTYTLVNYNQTEYNISPVMSEEIQNKENSLIRRVIDKDPCKNIDNSSSNDNDNKKDNGKCK